MFAEKKSPGGEWWVKKKNAGSCGVNGRAMAKVVKGLSGGRAGKGGNGRPRDEDARAPSLYSSQLFGREANGRDAPPLAHRGFLLLLAPNIPDSQITRALQIFVRV